MIGGGLIEEKGARRSSEIPGLSRATRPLPLETRGWRKKHWERKGRRKSEKAVKKKKKKKKKRKKKKKKEKIPSIS